MHGLLLLVQLENRDEAVLGRICSLSADGMLSSPSGEQYSIRAMSEAREIPDQSSRRVPALPGEHTHVRRRTGQRFQAESISARLTAAFRTWEARRGVLPGEEVLRRLVGHYDEGAEFLGFYALGEYLYSCELSKGERGALG